MTAMGVSYSLELKPSHERGFIDTYAVPNVLEDISNANFEAWQQQGGCHGTRAIVAVQRYSHGGSVSTPTSRHSMLVCSNGGPFQTRKAV